MNKNPFDMPFEVPNIKPFHDTANDVETPSNQIIYNTRNFQYNYNTGFTSHADKLTRYLNFLLRSYVQNKDSYSARIVGCDPLIWDIDPSVDKISIIITPGKMIIDSTLVELTQPCFLDITLSNYSNTFDEIIVSVGYKYNNAQASFQIFLLNSTTHGVTGDSSLLIDQDLKIIHLTKFHIVRNSLGAIRRIYHIYGMFTTKLYSQYLYDIHPLAVSTRKIQYNKLYSAPKLCKPFYIRNTLSSISYPINIMVDTYDKIHFYAFNYMESNRFHIDDLIRYSPIFDRNYITRCCINDDFIAQNKF